MYADEGRDAVQSRGLIERAAARADQVLVCRPGTVGNGILTQRRGSRRYELTVEGDRLSPGQIGRRRTMVGWTCEKLLDMGRVNSPKKRISIATLDLRTERHAMFVPHRVEASLMMSYLAAAQADEAEAAHADRAGPGAGPRWRLQRLDDRPPMAERPGNRRLVEALEAAAARWEIPLERESSAWPSVAGLVPDDTAVVCGMAPVTRDRGTPDEAVQRISLVQRTLLLSEYLIGQLDR